MSFCVKGQLGLISNIARAYENYKRAPNDRLTKESYLQTRLEALEAQFKIVTDTHTKILSEASDEILDNHEYFSSDMYSEVEETYIMYKSDLKEALSRVVSIASAASNEINKQANTKGGSHVHLPKLIIPVFSGTYVEWISFRDLFLSLVHNNDALDNVQKMHYLKAHLFGEAEQLLRHVPITAATYDEAWVTLNNRYNNKKYLVNCLMQRFMDQSYIVNVTAGAIKNVLDLVNDTLNGLKNLGVLTESWDVFIIHVVCSRLDSESRKSWEVKISTSNELPTLNELMQYLEARYRSLEFLDTEPNPTHAHVMHATATSVHAGAIGCAFCNKRGHKIIHCKEFCKLQYEARHKFVITNRLCYNCIGRNHSANSCRSINTCRICYHYHHSLLHPTPASGSHVGGSKSSLAVEVKATGANAKAASDNPGSSPSHTVHCSNHINSMHSKITSGDTGKQNTEGGHKLRIDKANTHSAWSRHSSHWSSFKRSRISKRSRKSFSIQSHAHDPSINHSSAYPTDPFSHSSEVQSSWRRTWISNNHHHPQVGSY
ncbi:unnamed protein product [Plutella xylostella]|uniref:(diamondback moth) hypothetical protein n=1 Tax=Plutella xylostella TaxID=51655 RepID=A0A8S4EZR1_PLUXY|nr:unnamed protein product [Plutella xylostella]